MSCCTSTTRPTASTADPPGDPVWRMAPGLRKPRLRPASAVSSPGCVQLRLRPASAVSSPGPPRRKPHLTRNVHGSHPSMHVFSLGRFCASPKPSPRGEDAELCSPDEVERSRLPPAVPVSRRVPVPRHKPSPRGEDAELCSPDAVEASRPFRRRRSRAASCVISCFQSSMLLHNLSSAFSLGKKASQRALRSSRVLLRTIATAHPAAATPHHAAPRPTVPHHSAPSSRNPTPRRSPASRPAPHRSPASRPAPHRSPASRPAPRHSPANRPAPAPFPAAAGFPQTFHRVSHISAGFPQRLSFPLAFLERDRVRSSESWVLPAA